ncbi:MAG: hypothetical protein M1832_006182 [Thelocarpon impressellum]|nr:MAG: hypothetical protein M1832_006182 [Thelocarpon impressellum]
MNYYHIACFEKIADLSQKTFVDRVIPVTRGTYRGRNLRAVNVFDGYLCCGGVERLVEGWRAQRLRWFDKRDGVNQEPANPAFEELLRRAGSSMYRPERTADMDSEEWFRFCTELAPIESDGPDDSEEWDLFDTYLGDENDPDFLPEGCDLSVVLDLWKMDQHLATAPDDELNDLQRRAKAELGAKAVRAIKRLSAIPMPNVQRTFLS